MIRNVIFDIGDVTLAGSVTVTDVIALQKYQLAAGLLTAEQGAQADINGDGRLNAADLTLLKRILLR